MCGNKGLYLPNKKTIQYTFTDGVIRPLNMHFLYQVSTKTNFALVCNKIECGITVTSYLQASAELEFDGVLHDEEELGKVWHAQWSFLPFPWAHEA